MDLRVVGTGGQTCKLQGNNGLGEHPWERLQKHPWKCHWKRPWEHHWEHPWERDPHHL
jgi:hypothetical protein